MPVKKRFILSTKKKISYRDAVVRDLQKEYPSFVIRKGKDPHAFVILASKLIFNNGFEWADFYESIEMNSARYSFTVKNGKIRIAISNYKGHYYSSRDN